MASPPRRSTSAAILLLTVFLTASAPAQFTFVPDVVFGTYTNGGPPENLYLDLYLPVGGTGPFPVLVWIHGGWIDGHRFPCPSYATALCSQGYVVASIDYRLTTMGTWPDQIHDCRGAIRWLRANAAQYNIDPERIGTWGISGGGFFAAFLGTGGGVSSVTVGNVTIDLEGTIGGNLEQSSRVQAACDWYCATDFLVERDFPSLDSEIVTSRESQLVGAAIQTVPEIVATANPISYASPDDAPILIQHGTADPSVPFNQSELLYYALRKESGSNVTFTPILNGGHGGGVYSSPANLAIIYNHFNTHVKNASPARVSVAATDDAAAEAGGDPATFTVTRTGSTAAALTVRLTSGGTAKNGVDHAPPPLFVVIPAGASDATVTITPQDDLLVEGTETFVLTLCHTSAYRILPASQSATATIADDDSDAGLPVITIAATDTTAAEAVSDMGTLEITCTPAPAAPLLVSYIVSGRATNGVDFQALSGSVTIPGGATSAPLPVVPIDDTAIEPSETVIITIEAATDYVIGPPATASVYIADDDKNTALPTVSVVVSDITASEPGVDNGAFIVSRKPAASTPLTVAVSFSGTAVPGDVAALPASVTIAANQSFATIPVAVLNDALAEGEESVVITLAPGAAYQLASAPTASLVVKDDDIPASPPLLQIEATPLVPGTVATIAVAGGQSGQIFGVAFASGPGFLDVPPFGHVLIDFATAMVVGTGVLDASGIGVLSAPVPSDPVLPGYEVWFQAFAIDLAPAAPAGLSPALARRVARR